MTHVLSVNVGTPRTVEWYGRSVTTAIWKSPVDGRVVVRGVNLAGDDQADRRVHGGPDKAVYAYASEDYDWWSGALERPIDAGTFGENLTMSGVSLNDLVIGSRWSVGSTVLEAVQPRTPCFKLGIRMGDADFVDRFNDAARWGAYFRIVVDGDVGRGDEMVAAAGRTRGITIGELGAVILDHDPRVLRRVVADPDVLDDWRSWARRALARL